MTRTLPQGYARLDAPDAEVVVHERLAAGVRTALASGTLYDWAKAQPERRQMQGRLAVYAAALPDGGPRVVVRHAHHGGMFAPLLGDRFLAPTRAAKELATSLYLARAGVPTPPVVAYAIYAAGPLLRRVDVMTVELPGQDLAAALTAATTDGERLQLAAPVASLLGALTQAGAWHPDLNVKNILLVPDDGGQLHPAVLDVDRVHFIPTGAPTVREANFRRLERSLAKWSGQHGGAALASIPPRREGAPPARRGGARRPARAGHAGVPAMSDATRIALPDVKLDRVGIVMMSAVGDAVHVLPVINAIKRRKQDAHITWVLQPGPATLVRGHQSVDEIVIFDRARGRKAFTDVKRELATRPFDLVLNLQVYFKAGLVTSFTRSPVKLGFDKARARDLNWLFTTHRIPPHPVGQHVQDQYFEFLDALGIPHEPVEWHLGPSEAGARVAARVLRANRTPGCGDRRRDQQAREGLAPRTVGAGDRRPARRLRNAGGAGGRALAARTGGRGGDHVGGAPPPDLGAGQRASAPGLDPRRVGARARPRHRAAAHGRRAAAPGHLPDRLHQPSAHRTRTGRTTTCSSTPTATRVKTIRSAWRTDPDACR